MTFYQEPEPVSVEDMETNATPLHHEERVATHKQALVIDMVSIEKSEFDKMKKFYEKRFVFFGFVALIALLLGMLLRIMADTQEVVK